MEESIMFEILWISPVAAAHRKIYLGLFQSLDNEVIIASTKDDGLKHLSASGQKALVILEKNNPPDEGEDNDFLAAIRRLDPDLPIIMIAGGDTACYAETWRKRGFTAVLHKPIDAKLLQKTVSRILRTGGSD
jgi:DNA-binding NtrC family response regulator